MREPADHLILGGGLAGGLLALALADAGRGREVTLVEQESQLGGNHTWSFHHTDLTPDEHDLVERLIVCTWPRQQVQFPGFSRTLQTAYSTISSERFRSVLSSRLSSAGVRVCSGRTVTSVDGQSVSLDDGTTLSGRLVVDARGPGPIAPRGSSRAGYQKFVGLEVELESDGPWTAPLLMDATVSQIDGYRFMYVLPFSSRRILVEDTVYSRNPDLDQTAYLARILDYVRRHGVSIDRVLRREHGVLPLPARDPSGEVSPATDGTSALAVGYRGGFFHCVTGYSLPHAARVALAVARASTPDDARAAVAILQRKARKQGRFARLLNRLMFHAMPAATRWTAFERFYRLPEATISRFYASESTWSDRARVLGGRPPSGVSLMHLLRSRRKEAHQQ